MSRESQDVAIIDVLERRAAKVAKRRQFFRSAGGLGLGLVGGTILGACGGGSGSPAVAATGPSDADILNFALNLEYLEAQFYHLCGVRHRPAGQHDGRRRHAGHGRSAGQQVPFRIPWSAAYAKEIAKRRTASTSTSCARRWVDRRWRCPRSTSAASIPTGAFSIGGAGGGAGTGAGTAFNPYASDDELPARRVHLRGRRRDGLQGRGAAHHQQDLPRGRRRHSRGRGLSRGTGAHGAVLERHRRRRPSYTDVPGDFRCARQPRRHRPMSTRASRARRRALRTSCRSMPTVSPSAAATTRCSTSSI